MSDEALGLLRLTNGMDDNKRTSKRTSKRTKKAPLEAEQFPHQDDAQVEHQEQPQEAQVDDQPQLPHQEAQEDQPPPKRGRGRPRKPIDPNAKPKPKAGHSKSKLPPMPPSEIKRGRGRPSQIERWPLFVTHLQDHLAQGEPPHILLLKGLEAGLPPALACQAAGIATRTWYEYVSKAKEPDCPQDLKDFVEACYTVRARKAIEVQKAMIDIATGGKGWWQALATWLERQFPEHYGQAQRPKETPPAVNVTINNAEQDAVKAVEDLMRQAEEYRQWKLKAQTQAALVDDRDADEGDD